MLHLKGAKWSRGGVIEIAQIPAMTKGFTLMNVLLVMLGALIGQIPWLIRLAGLSARGQSPASSLKKNYCGMSHSL